MADHTLRVSEFQDAEAFAPRLLPLLLEREAVNSVILAVLCRRTPQGADAPRPTWWVVETAGGAPAAVAVMTPPRPMLLSQASAAAAVDALVEHLSGRGVSPPSVVAPSHDAEAFAQAWTARTGVPHRPGTALGAYQLTPDDFTPPRRPPPGAFRPASVEDADQLGHWADAFNAEAGVPPSGETGRQSVDLLVREERLFVWCDPHPVSMAAKSGPSPNGIRVNFVYTPPEHRRRGYASACVAALSRLLLDSGRKFCFLFTDLDFPTSNKIYRELGYRHVGDCRRFDFGPAK